MNSRKFTHTWLAGIGLLFLFCGLLGCKASNVPDDDTDTDPAVSIACDNVKQPVTLELNCPALPNTIAGGKMVTDPVNNLEYLDYDIFAWNSFIAMNWPAEVPSESNGWRRGFPDTSKSFAKAAPDALAVWETLKEKREVFLADPFTGVITTDPQPQPWNAAPVYGPADQQVPACGEASNAPGLERHIVFATKANIFDTEDETAEVASEARETDEVLCKGHDPNCGVSGNPVGPRVWKGQPNDGGLPVVYEVKVNWDFFNYAQNFAAGPLWVQPTARSEALKGDIRLPARTSAAMPPFVPAGSHVTPDTVHGPNPLVTSYLASECLQGPRKTPCPAGSVHIKAAWLPLSPQQAASGEYHVAEAYFYKNTGADKCKQLQLFGLIGLHIIQRIHSEAFADDGTPNPAAGPRGGTFIFATWEHIGNDAAGFTYANLGPTSFDGQPVDDPQPFPNVTAGEDAIPLKRVYDLLPSTQAANTLVHNALGCSEAGASVWCNYRLIGTQYKAANLPSPAPTLLTVIPDQPLPNVEAPSGSGQPYYLANLVIESNLGLQQFQGTPPNFEPVDHFTGPKPPPGTSGRVRGQGGDAPEIVENSSTKFAHADNNLAWRIAPRVKDIEQQSKIKANNGQFTGNKRGAFNMGGCMGCHGVAQTQGYSFSFVLLDNQAGGAPDSQEEVVIPPIPLGAQ